MSEPELSEQQQQFVRHYCTGLSAQQAATRAGFSPSYSRKAAQLLKRPDIAAAIEANQAALRESQAYGPAQAVKEINAQIAMALAARSPNFMAAAKNLDLKCRIFGLVKEKIEVVTVDLASAIEAARVRVFNVGLRSGPPMVAPDAITDSKPSMFFNGPGKPGDPFHEDESRT